MLHLWVLITKWLHGVLTIFKWLDGNAIQFNLATVEHYRFTLTDLYYPCVLTPKLFSKSNWWSRSFTFVQIFLMNSFPEKTRNIFLNNDSKVDLMSNNAVVMYWGSEQHWPCSTWVWFCTCFPQSGIIRRCWFLIYLTSAIFKLNKSKFSSIYFLKQFSQFIDKNEIPVLEKN